MNIRAIFPGTFDPIHFGHIDIAHRASKLFNELVVAVYDKPLKNALFSPEERLELTRKAFEDTPGIQVVGYSGLTINFCQQIGAQVMVRGLRVFSDFEYEFRMALANHRLDPKIDVVALITSEEHSFLSSSTVREIASFNGDISTMVPAFVIQAVQRRFQELGSEQQRTQKTSLRD